MEILIAIELLLLFSVLIFTVLTTSDDHLFNACSAILLFLFGCIMATLLCIGIMTSDLSSLDAQLNTSTLKVEYKNKVIADSVAVFKDK